MFAAFVLLFVVVIYRVVSGFAGSGDFSWLHNFAPLSAIALCGAAYLPRRIAMVLPLAMLFLSDVILNLFHYHLPIVTWESAPSYLALALITGLGFLLRGRGGVGTLLGASVVASLIFYVLSNTGSWLQAPAYVKTFEGWLQALTTGLPGYPPSWWFYRHTLLGDLFFTLLFAGCMAWQARREEHPAHEKILAPW